MRIKRVFLFVLASVLLLNPGNRLLHAQTVIDSLESLDGWQIFSQGLTTQIKEDSGRKGMALNFDLDSSRNWVVVSKQFTSLVLPSHFKLVFYIRGISPDNNLELKFIDKKGNVFWKKWENFKFSFKWQKIELPSSEIKFGWGPDSGGKLGQVDKIELGVSKGLGGKGEVMVSALTYSPDENPVKASASSFESQDLAPDNAVDNSKKSRWSSDHSDPQWLMVDYGKIKEIIGLTLYWEAAYGKAYDIQVSSDNEKWQTVYSTEHGVGGIDEIEVAPVKARYVKVYGRQRGTYWGYSIYELVLKTTAEPWGEGEAAGVFMKHSYEFSTNVGTGAGKIYTAKFYIPGSWKDSEPVMFLIDKDADASLAVNGKNVIELSVSSSKAGISVKKYLKFDAFNTVSVISKNTGKDLKPFSTLVLSSDTNAYMAKLKKLREDDPKAYYYYLAETEPVGYFPYWLNKQEGYWTVVGIDKDFKESLFYEDGTLEPYKSFTIAPFLYLNDRLITRQDVKLVQSQESNYLPLPRVQWNHPDVDLVINSFAGGTENAAVTYMKYLVRNKSGKKIKGKLFLAVRPFEINPPWQWGGFNNIHDIRQNDGFIDVNEYRIFPLSSLSAFAQSPCKR